MEALLNKEDEHMDVQTVLHILRNPWGKSEHIVSCARFQAADLIERYISAYENMRDWAEENGVDTRTYCTGDPC